MTTVPAPARESASTAVLGVLALVGGLLHAVKGAVLLAGGPDLPVVPSMLLLFSIGLLGLRPRARGLLGAAGALLMVTAAVAAVIALAYQLQGIAPEAAGAPSGVRLAYAVATAGILFGLGLLGLAVRHDHHVARIWRLLPLVVAVTWFPVEALTAATAQGLGLLLAGLAWMAVAVAIWPGPRLLR